MVCVYCAIGQRASAVAKAVATLREQGAMDHTVVVVTEGNQPPGLAYIAPYAATSIAEHFMEAGRDVLIVYDDLTQHARAYRELSLLLRRPPGREAFPGDIFYIHSRLLERATHLSAERGGGSLTALPIIETEAQDMSAYIPTNLISITDGQIYLSPTLFELGVLPAVDVGKSVSRVGGKAQRGAFRAVAGDLKLAYAQFEELEAFSASAPGWTKPVAGTIAHGQRIRACLKQPHPIRFRCPSKSPSSGADGGALRCAALGAHARGRGCGALGGSRHPRRGVGTTACGRASRAMTTTGRSSPSCGRHWRRSMPGRHRRDRFDRQAETPDRHCHRPASRGANHAGPRGLQHPPVRTLGAGAGRIPRAVNLGLGASLRLTLAAGTPPPPGRVPAGPVGAIVFGSDQGLVGQFNEVIVAHAMNALRKMPQRSVVWAVGERVLSRLQDAGADIVGAYPVPGSVEGIAPLVDQLQFDTETHPSQAASPHIHLFYNRPLAAAVHEPVGQRLLPLDEAWRARWQRTPWPAGGLPEVMGHGAATLHSLIREHLFISLYRACAESLASENASRLAAMERADRNIEELLAGLHDRLHRQRQRSIDEELFDVVAGYEAVSGVSSET